MLGHAPGAESLRRQGHLAVVGGGATPRSGSRQGVRLIVFARMGTDDDEDDPFLTIEQAAKLLGLRLRATYRHADEIGFDSGTPRRIKRSDLMRSIEASRVQPGQLGPTTVMRRKSP